MAYDGQYAVKKTLILCDKKVRGGMTVCFKQEKCSGCDFAEKYENEHSEEVRL